MAKDEAIDLVIRGAAERDDPGSPSKDQLHAASVRERLDVSCLRPPHVSFATLNRSVEVYYFEACCGLRNHNPLFLGRYWRHSRRRLAQWRPDCFGVGTASVNNRINRHRLEPG